MSRAAVSIDRAPPRVARPWWRRPALYTALSLFVIDGLLLGQGLLAALLLMTVFGWLVPKALLLFKLRRDGWPSVRLAALFGITAIAIMATINLNNHLARQRATRLIQAIDLYRATHGRYPLALEALVPRYIAAVPRAKVALAFNQFLYENRARRVLLGYVEVPPLGRPCYDFDARRWHELDWRDTRSVGFSRQQSATSGEPRR